MESGATQVRSGQTMRAAVIAEPRRIRVDNVAKPEARAGQVRIRDFTADLLHGTSRERLAEPPDAWGGRAAVAWAEQLARSPSFDPEAERLVAATEVLDRIYGGGD